MHRGILEGVSTFNNFDAEALADVLKWFEGKWAADALDELRRRALCGDEEARRELEKLGKWGKNDVRK